MAEPEHKTEVVVENLRYPFVPVCSCGARFRGYLKHESAQAVADGHAVKPTSLT